MPEAHVCASPYLPAFISVRLITKQVNKILALGDADPSGADHCGKTALHFAAEADNKQIVKVILEFDLQRTLHDCVRIKFTLVLEKPACKL